MTHTKNSSSCCISEASEKETGRDNLSSLKTQEWLTTAEVAEYLRLPVGSVRNMTSNGQLTPRKLGRRNRYWLPELRELLLSQKKRGS